MPGTMFFAVAARDGADVEGGGGGGEERVVGVGELAAVALDGGDPLRGSVDRGDSLSGMRAVSLVAEDGDFGEPVAFAGACGMEGGGLSNDGSSWAQVAVSQKMIRADATDFFVGSEYEPEAGDYGFGGSLSDGRKQAGEKAFDIAGAAAVEHAGVLMRLKGS